MTDEIAFARMTRLRCGTRVERRQAAALAPLAGDRQDRDQRQDDRHWKADRLDEGRVGEFAVRGEQDDRAGGEQCGDADAGQKPEARAGVEGLARLDLDHPGQRDRSWGRPVGTGTPSDVLGDDGGHAATFKVSNDP